METRAARMLRHARRRAGLTQRELAARAGVPQATVARIETGATDPRSETLIRLLRACGEDLEALPRIGVGEDRTLPREMLRLSPEERLERIIAGAKWLTELDRARRAGG